MTAGGILHSAQPHRRLRNRAAVRPLLSTPTGHPETQGLSLTHTHIHTFSALSLSLARSRLHPKSQCPEIQGNCFVAFLQGVCPFGECPILFFFSFFGLFLVGVLDPLPSAQLLSVSTLSIFSGRLTCFVNNFSTHHSANTPVCRIKQNRSR